MTPAMASALVTGLVNLRGQYDRVYDVYVPIGVAVLAIIFIVSLFLLVKNRRRTVATRTHEHNPFEMSYAILLTLIVVGLLYVTFSSVHQTDTVSLRAKPAVTIDVIASRWEWDFYYPQYHFHVYSGVTGINTFVVPTNEAVRFRLTSVDVIHAFWIPAERFKHDNNPGTTQNVQFDFPTPGIMQGHCAEYCGLRHADMVFNVRAVSPARFQHWASSGGKASVSGGAAGLS